MAPTTDAAVAAAVEQVACRTGLAFGGSHRPRMVKAIVRGMHEVGATSPSEYADVLQRDAAAYETLVDRLTVGETYFFREPAHFELLRSIVRDVTGRRPGDGLRVWSAGCASGEEPYTVAIVLEEEGVLARSHVVGTDLSPRALDKARSAVYGDWSLRRCDDVQRARYFDAEGRRFRLRQRFVDPVELRASSLTSGPPAVAAFDVVLCRNVLIYLADDAVTDAAAALRDALVPGGWLIVGSSDPLLRVDGLDLVRTEHGLAYRRVAPGRACRLHREVPAPPTRPAPTAPVAAAPPAPPALGSGRPGAPPEAAGAPDADAVRTAGARGDHVGAERLLVQAIEASPLDAELRYLAATLHLGTGRSGDAAAAAKAAIYLEPRLAVAHLVLGRAEQAMGNPVAARRSFLNALEILAGLPEDAEVPLAHGERAGALATTAAELARE